VSPARIRQRRRSRYSASTWIGLALTTEADHRGPVPRCRGYPERRLGWLNHRLRRHQVGGPPAVAVWSSCKAHHQRAAVTPHTPGVAGTPKQSADGAVGSLSWTGARRTTDTESPRSAPNVLSPRAKTDSYPCPAWVNCIIDFCRRRSTVWTDIEFVGEVSTSRGRAWCRRPSYFPLPQRPHPRRGRAGMALDGSGQLNLDLSPLLIDRHADDVADLGRRLLGRVEAEMVQDLADRQREAPGACGRSPAGGGAR
jgi:hypothetical protein